MYKKPEFIEILQKDVYIFFIFLLKGARDLKKLKEKKEK
jgi:hypothetical protein